MKTYHILLLFLVVVVIAAAGHFSGRARRAGETPSAVEDVRVERLADARVKLVHRAFGIMGTRVTLTLFGGDETTLRSAARAALGRMRLVEGRLSTWQPGSEISRVNAAAGEGVPVHPDTLALLERAMGLGRETAGAFDVTAGPVIRLWKGREGDPSDEEIATARSLVGYDRIRLRVEPEPAVRLAAGMRLDLGGIAKGTIVDEAAAELWKWHVMDFLVDSGGDLLARGCAPGAEGIPVGVRDPRANRGTLLDGGRLLLRDAALCTSGSYEQPRHIVDPRTGRPAAARVLQASVVAPRCETADALATALMALGPEAGLPIIEARNGVEALLVVDDGDGVRTRESSGFASLREEAR